MTIFIDHQFRNIYNGEFTNWIKNNIINVLQSSSNVYVSKSVEDTKNILSTTQFDIVIMTGYDSVTITSINPKFKETKTISVIYDMNAEKLTNIFPDNVYLQDIIAYKSRLIFLSNHIVTTNELTKQEILDLYGPYNKLGVNISNKITCLSNKFDFIKHNEDLKKLIDNKYIVINDSINGLSLLIDDFDYIIKSFSERLGDFPNIKIVLLADKVPQKLYDEIKNKGLKDYFIILKDVSDQELLNIYKNSISIIFPSSLDTNIDKILLAYKENAISILNPKNDLYLSLFEKNGVFYDETMNLIDIVRIIMRSNKNTKDEIKNAQNENLINYITSSDSSIVKVINKLTEKEK